MLRRHKMQKDTLVLWARYNQAVNQKMDAIIKTLTPEEWNKNLGGYFESIRSLCSHLYICDFNWLKRFSKLRDFEVFKEPIFNREPFSFSEVLFSGMNEYLEKRPVLDGKIIAFVNELSAEDLGKLLKYTDAKGNNYERLFGGLVMHSFNHDTHHRGMISVYLEMLGHENDFNSLAAIL
jgi:uncharacterized damage-inducible protein DinB